MVVAVPEQVQALAVEAPKREPVQTRGEAQP
jgi:hypothetical protein